MGSLNWLQYAVCRQQWVFHRTPLHHMIGVPLPSTKGSTASSATATAATATGIYLACGSDWRALAMRSPVCGNIIGQRRTSPLHWALGKEEAQLSTKYMLNVTSAAAIAGNQFYIPEVPYCVGLHTPLITQIPGELPAKEQTSLKRELNLLNKT